jgi:hypothetical protein
MGIVLLCEMTDTIAKEAFEAQKPSSSIINYVAISLIVVVEEVK